MNIALVISSLQTGGAERVITDLAHHWLAQDHRVTIITFASPTITPFYPVDVRIELIQLNQTQQTGSLLQRLWNIGKRILDLRRTFKAINPHVIISFIDVTNITTLLAAVGLKQIPVIVSERTDPTHHILPSLYKKIRSLVYPRAYKVIVQTQSAKDYFDKLNTVFIIPNSVRVPKILKLGYDLPITQIISVGRLCQYKGFQTLIKAFALVHKVHPQLNLTIYGEGPQRGHLQQLIDSLDLTNHIHMPGITKTVDDVLANADLFVFPSLYEGFPNALCEAMAVGLPVIASKCSGNVDIVVDHDNGRLFTINDHIELSRVMDELINDPQQCRELGTRAKLITDKLNPQYIYDLWNKIVDEAVKR